MSIQAVSLPRGRVGALAKILQVVSLVKSLQTGLLLVTAAAGYISGCCLNITARSLAELLGSLFLAVSGSTVLNMAYDRDIDACMARTAKRPLPSGEISTGEAWLLGGLLVTCGLAWSAFMDLRYAGAVFAGVVLDFVVYTVLLKRWTAYSILIGGLAGGMPALAGRVLATGQVDPVGLLLALGVLLWIPTHIMTFNIRYQVDYARAGVPTFPALYGAGVTRRVIAVSTLLSSVTLFSAAWMIGLGNGLLALLGEIGLVLFVVVAFSLLRPGPRLNFAVYKGASIYMLVSMLLLIVGGL
jgi:heme o synthase